MLGNHNVKKELFRLLSLFLFTIVALIGMLGFSNFVNGVVDIQIYDTYYVVTPLHLILSVFIPLVFTIYLIRQIKDKFKSKLPNYILMIFTVLFLILSTLFVNRILLLEARGGGWVIYPPNAAFPEQTEDANIIKNPKIILFLIQLALTSLLVFIGIRIGKNSSTNHQPYV